MSTRKQLALLLLISSGCVLSSVGCASKLKCRYTALDAQHRPIPPHRPWVRGEEGCMALIRGLAEGNPPEGVGVEAKGPMKLRRKLQKRLHLQEETPVPQPHVSVTAELR